MHVNPLVSITAHLGANSPLSIQEKVWNHEYTDIAKLIHLESDTETLHLDSEDGQIRITNESKDKKVFTISEWTVSSLIYAVI
jgi:hypothetical protein